VPIRISNLRLRLDEPEAELSRHLARLLGLADDSLPPWRILRKSLDARDRDDLRYVYSAEVDVSDDQDTLARASRSRPPREVRIEPYHETPFAMPPSGNLPLECRPVVVGSGPAGLVAGYFLAEQGYEPLILERGRPVRDRIRDVRAFEEGGPFDPESNYLFGEGGAGTFSDGKLTCRGSGPDVRRVLELLAECKGKPSVVYEARPHLGSNRLPAVVKAIRRRILELGGDIRFSCRVEDVDLREGRVCGLFTSSGYIATGAVVLAIGHSARDTYAMLLRRGVPIVQKPFQMGVRIEQPQENVNRAQFGPNRLEDKLGAADYTLITHGQHDLFTFCMCAGGQIIPSVSKAGDFCTNGMSLSRRNSPFANSGLVVTVPLKHFPSDDILSGVRLQQTFERRAYELSRDEYRCPIQGALDFLDNRTSGPLACSYERGVVPAQIADLVPSFIGQALRDGLPVLDRRWHGRFLADAVLVGPEARGSAPVRIVRDEQSRESSGVAGLYPVGEGAGYAGGIVSAAVDGLRTAKAIVARFAPLGRS
jgi:uncharacterized FAD-dependent dehydrogenase